MPRLPHSLYPIRRAIVLLTCAAGLPSAATAAYRSREVGPWTVTPSKDGDGCFLTRDYDRNGGTTLLLGVDSDGANRLSVLNPNWSIKPKDKLKLNFRLSTSSYPAHFAVGITSDDKQGFVSSFGADFPDYFAASKTLEVTRGKVPVARLNLDGSDAAISELKSCIAAQRATPKAAQGKRAAPDDIPSDPFASKPARKSRK